MHPRLYNFYEIMNTTPNLAATKDRLAALAHEFQHFHDTKHTSYKDLDEAQTRLSYIRDYPS
jgi:hypothetical protein